MRDAEEKLGEVTGILKSMSTTLERVEDRVNASQIDIAELRISVKKLEDNCNECKSEDKDTRKSKRDHALEITRLIIASVIGALLTWGVTKL